MRTLLAIAVTLAPAMALAAGGGSVPSTDTITQCKNGEIYDADTKSCVAPKDSRLDDDARFDAARAFAYMGLTEEAFAALAAMGDQTEDRVLTYMGFTHRRAGNIDLAYDFYRKALARNPANILARSYMAQGYVQEGRLDLARAELTEIRRLGGRGTWAEVSLRLALRSGRGFAY